jgi:uncharacterized protein (DUF362 family)
MTREVIEAIGGMGSVVRPGERVFLKPNLCSAGLVRHDPIPTGDCSKPEIIITVAELCLEAGASEVIIGEAGQVDRFVWRDLRTLDGLTNLDAEVRRLADAYSADVRRVCLNADSPGWDAVGSPYSGLGTIAVSSLVTRADRIISVPVIKTHRWTQVTGSIKNLMGVTPLGTYDPLGFRMRSGIHGAPAGLERAFLDIFAALEPDLAVIDASICCEGNGPHVLPDWWGTTVDMRDRLGDWLMLASTDCVAADATATRVIGHDPAEVDQLQMAYRQGLGQVREDRIELVGADLGDLVVDFQPAEPTEGFGEVILPGLFMLTS